MKGNVTIEFIYPDDNMMVGEIHNDGFEVAVYTLEQWPDGEDEPIVEHVNDNRAHVYWRLRMPDDDATYEEVVDLMTGMMMKSYSIAREKLG